MIMNEQMQEEVNERVQEQGSPPLLSLDGEDNDPSREVDDSEYDKIIANEFGKLSLKQRNELYEEIHGVHTMAIKESPELIEESLKKFQRELDKMDRKSKRSYDIIAKQEGNAFSRNLIQGKEFRLRFLRTELFDVPKAVKRMLGYFNHVLGKIWGEDALKRFDGTMNWFLAKDSEQAVFRMGLIQLLPFRDRSGRKIMVYNTDAIQLKNSIRFKIVMYMMFVAGDDIETQRNGMIVVLWPGLQTPKPSNSRFLRFIGKVMKAIPTRFACFHMCFPSTKLFRLMRTTLSIATIATRVKVHTGNRIELQQVLMGFGIPSSMIPTTGTGTVKTKAFMQWVKARKSIEAIRKEKMHVDEPLLIIDIPGSRDVIFRSVGKSYMLNPGNAALRGIFEEYHSEHIQAGQTEKKKLVWKIVEEIEERGGRFLVWENKGWWVPLEDRNETRNKVAASLRGYNKQRKIDEVRQYSTISTSAGQSDSEKRRKF